MENAPVARGRWTRLAHPAPINRSIALVGLGFVASIVVHLVLGLWASGLLVVSPKAPRDDVISVQLVPPEIAPPPPPPSQAAGRPESEGAASGRASSGAQASAAEQAAGPSSDPNNSVGKVTEVDLTELSKEDRDRFIAQAKFCWNIPAGWTEPGQVSVTVRFLLNPDGTLKGRPVVVEFPASLLGKAAAENAVLAIIACAPFDLPTDDYAQWRDVQLRFTP